MPLGPAIGTLGAPRISITSPAAQRTLVGVRRDVAAFFGVAPRGPARLPQRPLEADDDVATWLATAPRSRSIAVAVTSWDEYRRFFGGYEGPGRLPYAVSTFFTGGGRLAYVVRIVHDTGGPDGGGRASGSLVGLQTSAGQPIILYARNEGYWGNRLGATLRFVTRPIAVRSFTSGDLVVDPREWVPGGSLLRLTMTDATRVTEYVDASTEEPEPAGPGSRRVLRLAGPVPPTLRSVEVVTAALEVVDADPAFPRREVLGDIGLRFDHPRWLARVVVNESVLVWPGVDWAGGTVRIDDTGLAPIPLVGGLPALDGPPVTLFARNVGSAGNRLRATLDFVTQPITVHSFTSDELFVDTGESVPVGSLLRLTMADGIHVLEYVDFSTEEPDPVGPGTRRVLRLSGPVPPTLGSVAVVTASLEVVDGDPALPTQELLGNIGFRSDHPRWLARVVVNESALVWPGVDWAGGTVRIDDTGLSPIPIVVTSTTDPAAATMSGGRDRWHEIVPDDYFDPLWVPGDELVGDGVQCLADHTDIGLLLAPDLYDPQPIVDTDDVTDPVTLCGPDFAPHVEIELPSPPQTPIPGLDGLRLDPLVSLDVIIEAQRRLVDYAEFRRDLTVLLDVPLGLPQSRILHWRNEFDSAFTAAYHPWLDVATVDDQRDSLIRINPSSFAAGIIAEREIRLGVQHGPANEIAVGAVRAADDVSPERHDELHINGINVFVPDRDGIRLTGARTLTRRTPLRQLSVVRLLTVLRLTLETEMRWAVFEPNNQALWGEVRRLIHDLLTRFYEAGAFRGATTKEAFFVRCDRTTMTTNDLDNGRVVCLVGVAPVEPVEYILIEVALSADRGVGVRVAG